MARILVTEKIAPSGLDRLRRAGHEIDERLGLEHDELLAAVRGAHALIVRSATTVSADVIAAGVGLLVVGRAGVGLDNVDVDAATRHGVMVVNAPHANTLSAAEHTMAILLAQARNVADAHASLTNGRWERSSFTGVELAGKTLGVVGLGRIGMLVARRAQAFDMRVVGYDPYIAPERAKDANVELVDIDTIFASSDFVTLHVARTQETTGLVDAARLAKAKRGIRIVNVARGGIVNEADLAEAIRQGHVAGAAIDVFETEPTTSSPLFGLPGVVVTPHLGASTVEAQDKAGDTIAEQVQLAIAGDFVPFAVNVEANEASALVRSFLPLAEQLGVLFAGLDPEASGDVEVIFSGEIGGYDNAITELAVTKGLMGRGTTPASYVNAKELASEAGIRVMPTASTATMNHLNTITIRSEKHALAGTLSGALDEPRIVMVDDHAVDLPPAPHMLVVRNDDRPGVIGRVGSVLGDAGVNIADMNVGRNTDGHGALMVIATSGPVPDVVVETVGAADGVIECCAIS